MRQRVGQLLELGAQIGEERAVREVLLEQPPGLLVVVNAPQARACRDRRLAPAGARDLNHKLADLRDLVGGEDHQRLVPGPGGFRACGCLALVVVGDPVVVGDGEYEAGDARTKACGDPSS
jgi:hypothetical protein